MNRLATQPLSFTNPTAATDEAPSLSDGFQGFGDPAVEHALRPSCRPAAFCPLHYERGYPYPLIVWLHGQGGSEDELRQIISRISLRNYVAVAPRGTEAAPGAASSGWTWSQDPEQVEAADERIFEAIDFVRAQLNVSPERIFIAGNGAGGTMALRMAFAHPGRFAGAISLDGLLPRSGQPLRRVNELRGMPLLISARINPSSRRENGLCRDLRLLHAAGMSLSLRHYSQNDSLVPLMLADVDRWIMDVICPSPEPQGR